MCVYVRVCVCVCVIVSEKQKKNNKQKRRKNIPVTIFFPPFDSELSIDVILNGVDKSNLRLPVIPLTFIFDHEANYILIDYIPGML